MSKLTFCPPLHRPALDANRGNSFASQSSRRRQPRHQLVTATAQAAVPDDASPAEMVMPDFVWNTAAPPRRLRAGLTTVPESTEDVDLPVTGTIPAYVDGRLFRNGPGVFEVTHKNGETSQFQHWFDGIATVHRFRIDGAAGTVTYKNRRTMPDVLATAERADSKAAYKTMPVSDMDPCRGVLGTFFQMWRPFSKSQITGKLPINISVTLERIPGVGDLVSRTDLNDGAVLDIDSLDNKKPFTFADLNPALDKTSSAAHGVADPDTKEYFNFVFSIGRTPATYTVFAHAQDGKTRTLAEITAPPCYIHSVAATKKYVILILYPLVINPLRLLVGDGFLNGMKFKPEMRTKIYVVSRAEEKVAAVYDTDAFFAFHIINAFDDDAGDVHVDICSFKDETIMRQLHREYIAVKPGAFFDPPTPKRFTLSGMTEARARYAADSNHVAKASVKVLSDAIIDLPRIAPRAEMRDYRYAYGISNAVASGVAFNSLVKVDVVSGEKLVWTPRDAACGEPMFVPKPGGEAEDDGVLLSVVLDAEEERSFLAVIDAQSMTEISRASVPRAVPIGFHGQYMEESFAVGSAS